MRISWNSAKMQMAIILLLAVVPSYGQTPPVILQGGDNIGNAFPILSLPFNDNGTTIGYTDDYDGTCGLDEGAPDVVYSFSPADFQVLNVSLCQSSNYDTRLYIFDGSPDNVIACNDDDCSNSYSNFISDINCIEFLPGHTYYIVIDGYGSAAGEYSLDINFIMPGPSILGSVHDTSGAPISGAGIIIRSGENPVWSDTTESDGYYYAYGLVDGAYMVEASKEGYFPQIQGPVNILACEAAFADFILERNLCDLIPDTNDIIEDEPTCYEDFEDIYNIGCSAEIWDTIPANCVFFGTSGDYMLHGIENRDTDWMEFELSDSSHVSLQGTAEFEVVMMLIRQGADIPCEFEMLNYGIAAACETLSINTYLRPGKYWIWVGPNKFEGVNCGSDYQFTLSSVSVNLCDYVPGDIGGNGVVNGIDVVYGVSYLKGAVVPPIRCDNCPLPAPFYAALDVNGNCVANGIDITFFVRYLKGQEPALLYCPDCPPEIGDICK